MTIFNDLHQRFIIDLLDHKVEFIIIGGYSVIFHGYVRTTGDLDIWLKPDNDNKLKLTSVLKHFDISDDSITLVQQLDFTKTVSFHFGIPPRRIEFLTNISGLSFHDAGCHCDYLELETYRIPVLGFHDLIINKMMSGRLKDQADVETLQKIHRK
jgi:hypothetical protein